MGQTDRRLDRETGGLQHSIIPPSPYSRAVALIKVLGYREHLIRRSVHHVTSAMPIALKIHF